MPLDPKIQRNELPESTWVYRRVLTFGFAISFLLVTLLASVFIARLGMAHPAAASTAIRSLTDVIVALAVVTGLLLTYYLVAPSGEQVAKMFATLAALKSGINLGGLLPRDDKPDPTPEVTADPAGPKNDGGQPL